MSALGEEEREDERKKEREREREREKESVCFIRVSARYFSLAQDLEK